MFPQQQNKPWFKIENLTYGVWKRNLQLWLGITLIRDETKKKKKMKQAIRNPDVVIFSNTLCKLFLK